MTPHPPGCWAVTYHTRHAGHPRPHTAILDAPWCAAAGIDPADLTTPEHAAFALALTLTGSHHPGPRLTAVRWAAT